MSEYREFNMKTIVVATDFSDASYAARTCARQLALRFSAKVLLMHVVEPSAGSEAEHSQAPLYERIDRAEDKLQEMVEALCFDDVRCTMIVRTGDIRETVAALVRERNADLLVIGTRGKEHKNGDRLGSVARQLLRDMPCPVLTVGKYVRQDAFEQTHRQIILFPTDFSKLSSHALAYAERLARHLGARLCILHVEESGSSQNPPDRSEEFTRFTKGMRDPSVVSECLTRSGNPADVIASVSLEKWADFVVMGVHGADAMDSRHEYEVAFDVIRSVRCPVFTIFVAPEEVRRGSERAGSDARMTPAATMLQRS